MNAKLRIGRQTNLFCRWRIWMTTAALLGIDSCPIEGFKQQEVENFFSPRDRAGFNNLWCRAYHSLWLS